MCESQTKVPPVLRSFDSWTLALQRTDAKHTLLLALTVDHTSNGANNGSNTGANAKTLA